MDGGSIISEVRKFIADKIARKEVIIVQHITSEIVEARSGIEGDDAAFYKSCAYSHIKDIVGRCIGKYNARQTNDNQIVLPGFEHLQVAYSVLRGGDNVLVPVDLLSDQELHARAEEYDAMAKGCRMHALEIRQYIKARRAQGAA